MTRAEALAEAQRRWGDCGEAYAGEFAVEGGVQYLVGYWRSRTMNSIEVRGSGNSYESALATAPADADRRAAR